MREPGEDAANIFLYTALIFQVHCSDDRRVEDRIVGEIDRWRVTRKSKARRSTFGKHKRQLINLSLKPPSAAIDPC